MNAQILTTTTLAALFCIPLPAAAADQQILTLVMPDAKVVAGVNVQQALATPFGQYVLTLIAPQDQQIHDLAALIGFDPRQDVRELLVATAGPAAAGSPGAPSSIGLAFARGTFDPAKIAAAAALGGAKSETYGGFTVLEDPKQASGIAFLNTTLAVSGDVANVKAAIDRLTTPGVLPAALLVEVNQWSNSQDAWVVDSAPLASLKLPAGAPKLPGMAQSAALQSIQQSAMGVKFGPMVVVTAQAQADTAQDATVLAGILQLASNLAQAQATQNPQAGQLLKSITVTTQGNAINLTMSVPQDQIQQLLKPGNQLRQAKPPAKKM
jgi:hypothetical protein